MQLSHKSFQAINWLRVSHFSSISYWFGWINKTISN